VNSLPLTAARRRGGGISPTLANLTLNGLEAFLKKRFYQGPCFESKFCSKVAKQRQNGYYRTSLNVIRHADIFIISGKSPRELERVRSAVVEFLEIRGLMLHENKTFIRSIYDGFQFLGWRFWKTPNGAFLGQIARDSQKAHQEKIKHIIKKFGNMPTPILIQKLNGLITGWTNYYRCANAIWKVWGKMNKYVYELLWKWARKRHGKRSRTWIFKRHWLHLDGRWTFFSNEPTKQPPSIENLAILKLYSARKTIIRPLPADINVFNLRNRKKIAETRFFTQKCKPTSTRRQVGIKQKGLCPECETPLS
jgi:RNA-directed DNA polymerase